MNTESVAEIAESKLLRTLYEDRMCRSWILPHDLDTDHCSVFDISLPSLLGGDSSGRGDVDLLVVPSGRLHESTALQFKRVKVDDDTFRTGLANKVHEMRKLAKEANLLVELGFHRVYAIILVLVDSREIGGANPWLNSTPASVIQAVNTSVSAAGFLPHVWVESVEICQPFEANFRQKGSSGGRQLQRGLTQAQAVQITAALRRPLPGAA